jgi:hypothetical protein
MAITEGAKKSLIADVADAVEGELGTTLLQQNGLDEEAIRFGRAAVVVQQSRDLEHVECSQMPVTRRVVVVAMNCEDWNCNVEIMVFIVDMVEGAGERLAGVAEHLQLAGTVAQAVQPQRSHHLIESLARRGILVEEVAGQEDQIDIVLAS